MAKRKRSVRAHAAVSSTALIESLSDMVFYAMDQASPYPLALTPETNSLAKIEKLTLPALMIDRQGATLLWTIINAHLPRYGGRPVSLNTAAGCRTAGDVHRAAAETVGAGR